MTRRMNPEMKKGRKLIVDWAGQLRFFAECHKNSKRFSHGDSRERGYEESYSDSRTRVAFQNSRDFGIFAEFQGGLYKGEDSPRDSRFAYVRGVLPYGEGREDLGDNLNVASKLVVPIVDWARAIGMSARINYNAAGVGLYSLDPSIGFGGELPPERFGDFVSLVRQVENHIDWNLDLIDKEMERPFRYVLVETPHKGCESTKIGVYKLIKSLDDLQGARCVLVARKPINEHGLTNPFIRSDANVQSDAEEIGGKVLSVDEYVSGIKVSGGLEVGGGKRNNETGVVS